MHMSSAWDLVAVHLPQAVLAVTVLFCSCYLIGLAHMALFRRKKDSPPVYEAKILKDGEQNIAPPAVYRKLQQIKSAMLTGDAPRVRHLQQSLMKGGWELPRTPQDCDDIETRLREHAAKAFN